jgi:hypothetical protein
MELKMINVKNAIAKIKNKEEKGMSDLINALILMPLMIILIFTVLNVGNYLYTLSTVTSEAALGARMTGLYGGEDSRVAQQKLRALPGNHATVSSYIESRIYSNGACTIGLIKAQCDPPVVSCTKSTSAVTPGSIVSCDIKYKYKSFLSGVDLGISSVLEREQNIKQSTVSEISWN